MKLLAQTISVLSLFGLACGGCTENQFGTDGCEPDPFLCRITCNKEDQPACKLEEFDPNIPVCGNITTPENYEDFEANNCEIYCASSDAEEDETKRCRFWRFDHLQKGKTCSLMSDSQCKVFDPCFGHCQCGDMGCPDDTNPAPPGKACAAPIGFEKNHIHWTCHNTGISTGEIPNPYSPSTTELPPATVCTSVSKCADWQEETSNPALERKLQVSCDGTEGKWILDPDAGGENAVYDEVILNGGSDPIGEPSCTGGGVLLEIPVANIEESGTQLVCDDPVTPADGMYKMGHPNTCILLCDYQLGMTINSELDEEGEAFFKNQAGNITEGSVVTCWGR